MVRRGFPGKNRCVPSERQIYWTRENRKELEVIKSMKFFGIFSYYSDIVAEERPRYSVGPGRGSARKYDCLSVGITEINPLDYSNL